jgi:hypothetical protein
VRHYRIPSRQDLAQLFAIEAPLSPNRAHRLDATDVWVSTRALQDDRDARDR